MQHRRIFWLIVPISGVILLAVAVSGGGASAQGEPTPSPSVYKDLRYTEIRGIDSATIEGYRTGSGLGMALPAELNGYPGPRHVLELAEELELTVEQHTQIQALFDDMLPQAIALGEQILDKEAELELAFRNEEVDETFLRDQLDIIEGLRAELRFVHLQTHLSTVEILTPHQVHLYNSLRGYTTSPEDNNAHHGH